MSLLTEQEIRDIANSVQEIGENSDRALILSAQKAVIEKIKAQGATAYLEGNPEGIWFVAYSVNTNAPQIPLYSLPEGD